MLKRFILAALAAAACASGSAQVDLESVLKELPAKDGAVANWAFSTLTENVPQNVAGLAAMLKPSGDNSDQPARYALHGLGLHVQRPGAPAAERAEYNQGVAAALPNAPDDDARAFLLQLLQQTGDDASVPAIAAYLPSERLKENARMALAAIGGEAAAAALSGAPLPEVRPVDDTAIAAPSAEEWKEKVRAETGPTAWGLLNEGLRSDYTNIREAALDLAAKEFPGDQETRRLIRLTKRALPERRFEFVRMLAKRERENPLPTLEPFIDDDNKAARDAAALALAQVDSNEAETLVAKWLDEVAPGEETTAAMKLIANTRIGKRLLPQPDEEGFVSLFNGKDLTGWTGWKRGFVVEDGALVCKEGTHFNLYTRAEYGDFILRFDFKLTPAANNGIGIRAPLLGKASEEGMEVQLIDDTADEYSDIKDYQLHGAIYGLAPSRRGVLKPVGEWNSQEIHVQGSQVRVTVNGELVSEADVRAIATAGAPDGKEHPGAFRSRGHVALLGHGDVVHFKNLRLKSLDKK